MRKAAKTQRVFVYGSLRRGEPGAGLLEGARFLGTHVTEPRFTMCDLGEYPAVVAWGVSRVFGEVYEIDDALLARLDVYEDYPKLYTRRMIPTSFGKAWIYLLVRAPAIACVIGHGDWLQRDRLLRDEDP